MSQSGAGSRGLGGRLVIRLRAELTDPKARGAYLMLVNAALTGVLGLAFWAWSSRVTTAHELGSGAAWVAAVITVSTLGQLNATLLLPTYLGRAGNRSRDLVLVVLAVSVPVSVLAGWGYFSWLAPTAVRAVSHAGTGGLVFALSCGLWTAYTVLDAAFAGVRGYGVVPLKNGIYGVLKLAALPLLVPAGVWAVPLATVLPLIAVVPPFTGYLLGRLRPGGTPPPAPGAFAGLTRVAFGDWVASGAATIATSYLPVLVVQLAGTSSGAAFVVVWSLAQALDVAIVSVSVTATIEIVADPPHTRRVIRGTLTRLTAFAVVVALVGGLGSVPLLSLYSPHYVHPGAEVLALLTIACFPRAIGTTVLAVGRAARAVRRVLLLQVLLLAGVVGGCFVLVPRLGPVGGAWAWLGAGALVAVVALMLLPQLAHAAGVVAATHAPTAADRTGPTAVAIEPALGVGAVPVTVPAEGTVSVPTARPARRTPAHRAPGPASGPDTADVPAQEGAR